MENLKIRFFSDSFKSKRASHRIRGHVVSTALTELGYDAQVASNLDDIDKNTIVVFLKQTLLSSIHHAKKLGAKTVYDLCDNKFDEKDEYLQNCAAADLISVNSEQMAASTLKNTGKSSILMPDPFERPILSPQFHPGKELNILWFGSQSSLAFLPIVEIWQRLEKEIGNYRYHMIMSKPERLKNKMHKRIQKGEIKNVNLDKIEIYEWTWDLQGNLLRDCDIVLMPVATENYRTDTKSANRVIDSLVSGKWVITSPLASYLEFKDYTWQDENYIQGIRWALENPKEVIKKIQSGQDYSVSNFSPKILANKFIEDLRSQLRI